MPELSRMRASVRRREGATPPDAMTTPAKMALEACAPQGRAGYAARPAARAGASSDWKAILAAL
jgi:hypothetical protein